MAAITINPRAYFSCHQIWKAVHSMRLNINHPQKFFNCPVFSSALNRAL